MVPSCVRSCRRALIAVTLGCLAVLYTWHSLGYFFLFDDFALVGDASRLPVAEIFRQPLFGFYRPFAFLVTRVQFAAFSWSAPGGYIAGSLVLHGLNGALVYFLIRQLRQDRDTALLATLFFLLSPWSGEAYFWLSGRFDLLATSGALGAWLLGLVAVRSQRLGGAMVAGTVGCLAASVGILSKEVAVTIPAVFVVLVLVGDRPRDVVKLPSVVYVGCLTVLVGLYMVIREHVLPGLGGAYGDLHTLVGKADVMHNLWMYVRACVVIPFPDGPTFSGVRLGTAATVLFAGAACAIGFAAMAQWRLVLLIVIGFLLAIAPVVWAGLPPDSFGSGRFLYLAGVWPSLFIALGLRRLQSRAEVHPSRPTSAAYVLCLIAMIAPPFAAVTYQATMWHEASRLARMTMDQVRPYMNGKNNIFIANLPYWFGEGPYVLKGYAFSYYFHRSTHVRVRPMNLRYVGGESWFAGWLDDPAAGPPVPGPGETLVTLQLPIKHQEP